MTGKWIIIKGSLFECTFGAVARWMHALKRLFTVAATQWCNMIKLDCPGIKFVYTDAPLSILLFNQLRFLILLQMLALSPQFE